MEQDHKSRSGDTSKPQETSTKSVPRKSEPESAEQETSKKFVLYKPKPEPAEQETGKKSVLHKSKPEPAEQETSKKFALYKPKPEPAEQERLPGKYREVEHAATAKSERNAKLRERLRAVEQLDRSRSPPVQPESPPVEQGQPVYPPVGRQRYRSRPVERELYEYPPAEEQFEYPPVEEQLEYPPVEEEYEYPPEEEQFEYPPVEEEYEYPPMERERSESPPLGCDEAEYRPMHSYMPEHLPPPQDTTVITASGPLAGSQVLMKATEVIPVSDDPRAVCEDDAEPGEFWMSKGTRVTQYTTRPVEKEEEWETWSERYRREAMESAASKV
jgi:hypothetical protein